MTDPSRARPVPGPPRPGSGPVPGPGAARPVGPDADVRPSVAGPDGGLRPGPEAGALAGLEQRPVAEHVAVFEAEHDRLQRELATIDQL